MVAFVTIGIENIKLGDKDESIADVDRLSNALVTDLGLEIGGGNEAAGATGRDFFVRGNHIHLELLLRQSLGRVTLLAMAPFAILLGERFWRRTRMVDILDRAETRAATTPGALTVR